MVDDNVAMSNERRVFELERMLREMLEYLYDREDIDSDLIERAECVLDYDTDDMYEDMVD